MITWNVMLVDHDKLFSAALATLLSGSQFRISHHASSLPEAISALRQGGAPDLVVVDAPTTASPDELAQFKRLRNLADRARVVVLAGERTSQNLSFALQGGADGYLNKSMSCDVLQRSLQLVMLGEAVFPADVANLLITTGMEHPMPSGPKTQIMSNELSKREVQILRCLLAGQSNKAIARNLSITESTVKMHFKNVMRKIHAQNRTQAAVWAIQNGLSPLVSA